MAVCVDSFFNRHSLQIHLTACQCLNAVAVEGQCDMFLNVLSFLEIENAVTKMTWATEPSLIFHFPFFIICNSNITTVSTPIRHI